MLAQIRRQRDVEVALRTDLRILRVDQRAIQRRARVEILNVDRRQVTPLRRQPDAARGPEGRTQLVPPLGQRIAARRAVITSTIIHVSEAVIGLELVERRADEAQRERADTAELVRIAAVELEARGL